MESPVVTNQGNTDELPLFPQEEWYEVLLRYGLYIGAAFQLLCIFALIFDISPKSKKSTSKSGEVFEEDSSTDNSYDEEDSEDEASYQQQQQQQHKSRRQRLERKKRR